MITILEMLALLILALIIAIEHRTVAYLWRRRWIARVTLGVATVMATAGVFVLTGTLDGPTWLFILFAFGVAGAVTAGLYAWEEATGAEQMRGKIDEQSSRGKETSQQNPGQ